MAEKETRRRSWKIGCLIALGGFVAFQLFTVIAGWPLWQERVRRGWSEWMGPVDALEESIAQLGWSHATRERWPAGCP